MTCLCLDPNRIKIEEKSYKNVLICHIGYMTVKNVTYIKINRLNPLYVIIDKISGYIGDKNGNKHLALVPFDESKYILQKYKELWTKIKDLIT